MMDVRRGAVVAAAWIVFTCPPAPAQTGPPPASAPAAASASDGTASAFEVATVKPHPAGPIVMTGLTNTPDGANAMALTLTQLVARAYELRSENQLQGTPPGWAMSERYDIQAKFSDADTSALRTMSPGESKALRQHALQSLLAERFHLKIHSEIRQVPVYELVVAKGGPKLQDAASDQLRKGPDGKPLASFMQFLKAKTTAQGYSMGALAALLSEPFSRLGRPVLDKTSLTGTYDFTLDWSPQMSGVLPGVVVTSDSADDSAPTIFTALGDLGLKLQASTGPLNMIVIDHVERPTPD